MISFHDLERTVDRILHGTPQLWTITGQDGSPIISFKSFLKAEYKSTGKVVFEPIEMNSFAAYNKTNEPREYYFELALQVPNNDFASAISKLEELKKGTDLFYFVTPYLNFNDLSLEGYSTMFETTSSMMVVGLHCKEILQVQQGYTNVEVNDATPISQGDAANSDNASTSDTGITNTNSPSGEEEKQTNQSIIFTAKGGTIIPSSKNKASNGGGSF